MIPPFLPYAPFLFRFLCLLRLPFFKFFLPLWAFFPALPVSYSPTPGLCGSPSCRNGASPSAVSVLPVPPPHSRPTVLNSSPPLPAHLLPVPRLQMRWGHFINSSKQSQGSGHPTPDKILFLIFLPQKPAPHIASPNPSAPLHRVPKDLQ